MAAFFGVKFMLQCSTDLREFDDANVTTESHLVQDPTLGSLLQFVDPLEVVHTAGVVQHQGELGRILTNYPEEGLSIPAAADGRIPVEGVPGE